MSEGQITNIACFQTLENKLRLCALEVIQQARSQNNEHLHVLQMR